MFEKQPVVKIHRFLFWLLKNDFLSGLAYIPLKSIEHRPFNKGTFDLYFISKIVSLSCSIILLAACSTVPNSVNINASIDGSALDSFDVENPLNINTQFLVHLEQGGSSFNGVLVSDTGLLISVSHGLKKNGLLIKARLMNGQLTSAKLLYNNPEFDIAVLQLTDETQMPYARLNTQINLHQPIFAVGRHRSTNSLKITQGNIKTAWINLANMEVVNRPRSNIALQNAIIHNAKIEQGFSGGALINQEGELVAINHSILDSQGINLSIALSIDNFLPIIAALEHGYSLPIFPELVNIENRIDFLLAGLSRNARRNNIKPHTIKWASIQIKQAALEINLKGDMSEQQLFSWVWNGFLQKLKNADKT